MREDDAAAVHELSVRAFADHARRRRESIGQRPPVEAAHMRLRQLLSTDPGGCWVAENGGLAGAVLALVRERIWGLSLLVVDPGVQSAGLGRALLHAALLRTALARIPAGGAAEVEWITARQGWAVDVAIATRLELQPSGAVFVRGDVGPLAPYLPSGAYL